MAYVPSFFFARQQFLLPRKAFWGIACALRGTAICAILRVR